MVVKIAQNPLDAHRNFATDAMGFFQWERIRHDYVLDYVRIDNHGCPDFAAFKAVQFLMV